MNLGIVAAVLLGLRHATDPDHLTALSTLVLTEKDGGARRAGTLGVCWGLGHAVTLIALGLPVVFFRHELPAWVSPVAEKAVGVIIILLAICLLLRWARGQYHTHPHQHGPVRHEHPHVHEVRTHEAPAAHAHPHAEALGRTPMAAFGIGLMHGAGGSAAAGVLIVGANPNPAQGAIALGLFAAATAVSMGALSAAFGHALSMRPVARQLARLAPLLGVGSLVFGVWYAMK